MKDNLDDLLKGAFTLSEEPDALLTQKILQKAKGEKEMRKSLFKKVPVVAAISAAVLMAGGLTAYAAWQYLSMDQVAEEVGNEKLAQTFQSGDVVHINESQTYGDYKIMLMGTASGRGLSSFVETEDDGTILDDETYAVVSIEKTDGSAMPDVDDEEEYDANRFLVSPFIKGEDPLHMNVYYMAGGANIMVQDGIQYQILHCDNLEAFAERGVYLGVLSNMFYDVNAYNFDKETGEITRNESYDGVNALFNLPLDVSKADEAAADELLAKWMAEADSDDEEESNEKKPKKKWPAERVQEEAVLIPEFVKTYPASQFDEIFVYEYEYSENSQASVVLDLGEHYAKDEYGTKTIFQTRKGKMRYFLICERAEDGTFTLSLYKK